jgi:hypothetical protein
MEAHAAKLSKTQDVRVGNVSCTTEPGCMIEVLARLGYASKAAIYAIVGMLAILTVANRGGRITDTSGALRVVLTQPFGRALLMVLACGLCGYAVWRLLDSFRDPDRDGTSPSGLMVRFGNAMRGIGYGTLGLEAFRLVRGSAGSNGDQTELWTARLLDVPLGEILVGGVGVVLAGYGARELIRALTGTHDHKLDWSPIPRGIQPAVQWVSLFGVAVRGALLVTLGVFLVRAALTNDPNQAAGQRESFLRLGGLVEGRWFLALIAAGLIAYAVDQLVHAWCRRIRPVTT